MATRFLPALLKLGGILSGYLVILWAGPLIVGDPLAHWLRLLLPSAWLLVGLRLWLAADLRALPLHATPNKALPLTLLFAGLIALAITAFQAKHAAPLAPLGMARLVVLTTLVPVAEELFFRGVLFALVRRELGLPVALVAVSLLFGFLHAPQGAFLQMAGLSLLLCGLVWLTDSIGWAILVHAVWNALAIVGDVPDRPWRIGFAAAVCMMVMLSVGVLLSKSKQGASQR